MNMLITCAIVLFILFQLSSSYIQTRPSAKDYLDYGRYLSEKSGQFYSYYTHSSKAGAKWTPKHSNSVPYTCYQCMSPAYQQVWQYLSHYYYPPLNFSHACENPQDYPRVQLGKQPCSGVCLTLVETVPIGGISGVLVSHRYMRACIDRLLLFGLPEDWLRRNRLTRSDRCTVVDRRELQARTLNTPFEAPSLTSQNIDYRSGLFQTSSKLKVDPDSTTYRRQQSSRDTISIRNEEAQKDLVTICSCLGTNCNNSPIVTNEASPGRLSRTSRTRSAISTSPGSPWHSDSTLILLCSVVAVVLHTSYISVL